MHPRPPQPDLQVYDAAVYALLAVACLILYAKLQADIHHEQLRGERRRRLEAEEAVLAREQEMDGALATISELRSELDGRE